MPQGMDTYAGVDGTVSLSGSSFSLALKDDNIRLSANGIGEGEFVGNGTYYIENNTDKEDVNVWMIPVFKND